MIAIIQCAGGKATAAGHLVSATGKRGVFVAQPQAAPASDTVIHARPDDLSDTGVSWRDVLLTYNETPGDNPLRLYPAWQLYDNPVYGRLIERFRPKNVYILSAGWGLISADFLTPYYDITFSASARNEDAYKRRRKPDRYRDFCMLPRDTRADIVFFGGKDYLPLFASLTSSISAPKTVFYNSAKMPPMPGCMLKRFETKTRTNWHYACANAFVDGKIDLDG